MKTINMTDFNYSNSGYPDLFDVLKKYNAKRVVLIGGKKALLAAENKIRMALEKTGIKITGSFVYGTECTKKNISSLANNTDVQNADILFAIGGGKAIDTVKALSLEISKPVFSFPTIASTCSATTSLSVVYQDDGSFDSYESPIAPVHTFIDGEIISKAPDKYLWAGIGDGLSKQVEVEYSSRGQNLSHSINMGVSLSKSCADPFFKYASQALKDCSRNAISRAIEEVSLNIIISTGYVSNLTNDTKYYYNSSLAHAFYNGVTALPKGKLHLHGEIVSFGVLVLLAYDENKADFDKYCKFNHSIGLPVSLQNIDVSLDELDKIANVATKTNEWLKAPNPFTRERFILAIKLADEYGKKIQSNTNIL